MAAFLWLPPLPAWVPYPKVVWFVVEGVLLGLAGLVVRDGLGPALPALVIVGNVLLFVGAVTTGFGVVAYAALLLANR